MTKRKFQEKTWRPLKFSKIWKSKMTFRTTTVIPIRRRIWRMLYKRLGITSTVTTEANEAWIKKDSRRYNLSKQFKKISTCLTPIIVHLTLIPITTNKIDFWMTFSMDGTWEMPSLTFTWVLRSGLTMRLTRTTKTSYQLKEQNYRMNTN